MEAGQENSQLPTVVEPLETSLPTVRELFLRSWQSLKHNFVRLFLLGAISLGAMVVWFMGAAAIVLFSLGGSVSALGDIANFDWNSYFLSLDPGQFVIPVILFAVLTILFAVFSAAVSYGQILLLGDDGQKGLWTHIRQGFRFIIPVLVVEFLVGMIIAGNFFLFVVPGIVAGVLLSLTSFEVMLNNKRGTTALKGSATIINQHFGYLLVKVLAIIGIQIVFQLGVYLLQQGGESLEMVLGLYNIIGGLFINWFSLIYAIELYKEVRNKTDWNKQISITWMGITSLLGWVLSLALMVWATTTLGWLQSQFGINQFDQQIELPNRLQEN
jgi:hypothetical protein